jgi:hypothetical protein
MEFEVVSTDFYEQTNKQTRLKHTLFRKLLASSKSKPVFLLARAV